jgi:hypothetical protein
MAGKIFLAAITTLGTFAFFGPKAAGVRVSGAVDFAYRNVLSAADDVGRILPALPAGLSPAVPIIAAVAAVGLLWAILQRVQG